MPMTLRNAHSAGPSRVSSPWRRARYPAAGGRATKLGRKPYWGMERPRAWPAMLPSGTGGMPAATAEGATMGVPPSVEDRGPCSGAAAVQLGGTDSGPISAALPRPADAALPRPPSPLMPLSGPATASPSPLAAAFPNESPTAEAAAPPVRKPMNGPIVLLGA
jgi:hypothetical protein